ncbi:MAG: RsmD family RNA methyltransferase [Ignavibacteria bacterium]|nr:RsmD family RNA methyltransferase [Ignavibacteria bacterium]
MGYTYTAEQRAFFEAEAFAQFRLAFHAIFEKYADPLRIQTRLRSDFPSLPPELISAGVAQCLLQQRAVEKTGLPAQALYTRESFEQASSAATARLHASLLHGHGRILEWCGGAGSDTVAIARHAGSVTVFEADAEAASFLRHNVAAAGLANVTVVEALAESAASPRDLASFDALFADPSRRREGRRTIRGEQYSPPVSLCLQASETLPTIVKTAPASDFEEASWSRMFVALGDECKEQLLLRGFDVPAVCAVDAASGERWTPSIEAHEAVESPKYLIEPHAAIIRTGAVQAYFAEYAAVPSDPMIAYGLSATLPRLTRWHAVFEILDVLPFQRTRVQEAIRLNGFGPLTEIKKRGFRLLPEEVRAMFRFDGTVAGVLICTRIQDEHVVYLCRRVLEL